MILINSNRLGEWLKQLMQRKDSATSGITEHGWKWEVIDRYKRDGKKYIVFRLLSPNNNTFERSVYGFKNQQFFSDEFIGEALVELTIQQLWAKN